jgi:lipid-binding SYLF domain-containing protein
MSTSASGHVATVALVFVLGLGTAPHARAADESVSKANETITLMKKADPGLSKFFSGAVGYAVFPKVAKGAIGVGGAHGSGVLFEGGAALGKTSLSQVSIGFQLGGQAYSEIVFFEKAAALTSFKQGKFAFAAQVSAVAIKSGASANAKYQEGVAVFTMTKGGLMYEASVGGQKFSYQPFGSK